MEANGNKPDSDGAELIALTVHQLRSPLTVLRGYIDLLRDEKMAGALNETQKKYIDSLEIVTDNMRKIVNDFLDMSRLESRTVVFTFHEFSLKDFLQKLLGEVKVLVDQKHITIETDIEDVRISNDEHFLRQALLNIITNAVKYTPENSKVKVRAKRDQEDFLIEISDTGYGIPEDEQPKIFERFFRASNIREHEPIGTGLGLYITKLIMEQMAGSISFVSQLGKGTTFTIRLSQKGKQISFGYERR